MDLKTIEETALIEHCITDSTDKRILREFIRRYGPMVLQTITWICRRSPATVREDREDIFQEVFASLFEDGAKALRNFDPKQAHFATYLLTITKHLSINACKRKRKNDVELTEDMPEEENDPRMDMENKEMTGKVRELLASFSGLDRLFYHLYFKEYLPPETIARVLGISTDSVYSKKAKLVEKIKKNVAAFIIKA